MTFTLSQLSSNKKYFKKIYKIYTLLSINGFFSKLKEKDEKIYKIPFKLELKVFDLNKRNVPFWYYDHKNKKHFVCLPNSTQKENFEEKEDECLLDDVHSVIHELSHAYYSPRDINKINEYLKKQNVPFDVFNIFEDIYIENKVSREFLLNNRIRVWIAEKFNLLCDVSLKKIESDDSFKDIIFKMLYNQGEYETSFFSNSLFVQMKDYFDNIKDEDIVINRLKIVIDFYNQFKDFFVERKVKHTDMYQNSDQTENNEKGENAEKDKKEQQKQKNNAQEKVESTEQEENAEQEIINEIINESVNIQELVESKEKESVSFNFDNIEIEHLGGDYNILNYNDYDKWTKKDIEDIKKIKSFLNNLKSKKTIKKYNKKTFNANDYDINKLIDFATGINYDAHIALLKKIVNNSDGFSWHLFLDCSGSMKSFFENTTPIVEATKLLIALNELSLIKRNINITLTLHKERTFEKYKFPLNSKILLKIPNFADGGYEGFENALNGSMKEIKNADEIYIISDLMYREKDEKAINKFLKNNKNAFSIYAGKDNEILDGMKKKYLEIQDKIITSNNIIDLVTNVFLNKVNQNKKFTKSKKIKI